MRLSTMAWASSLSCHRRETGGSNMRVCQRRAHRRGRGHSFGSVAGMREPVLPVHSHYVGVQVGVSGLKEVTHIGILEDHVQSPGHGCWVPDRQAESSRP